MPNGIPPPPPGSTHEILLEFRGARLADNKLDILLLYERRSTRVSASEQGGGSCEKV